MAVEFLVKARARKIYNKGAIGQTVKESPAVWGGKERLPDFLIFRVSDATKADIDKYNRIWVEEFTVTEEDTYFFVRHTEQNKANRPTLTQAKRNRFKNNLKSLGVTSDDVTISGGGVRIAKVIPLQWLNSVVNDTLRVSHKHRQYHIRTNGIDNLVAQGNDLVEMTLAQFESNLVDGFD
ncbi:MAG: hypothetical protein COB84_01865 [Rhodobacteraceae bacterium]|nr:MAG: hypothetical protein COB84_01865 [Paracoccaceae bacterium]